MPTLTPKELQGMLARGEDFILLDIRIPLEASKFWIDHPNRLSIHLNQLSERRHELPTDKKVVVLDLNGKRSPVAARYLVANGFSEVVKTSGGMLQWIKDGLPVAYP